MTTPTELEQFVLWMAGAIDIVGERSPDQETWDKIRARVAEIVGGIVKERLLAEKRQKELEDAMKNSPPAWYPYPSIGTTTGTGRVSGGLDPTWKFEAEIERLRYDIEHAKLLDK